ncbi:MAG: chromate transporter [Alphaproteobacteria bacterium]|nr:chromate transporter [Alphaproteobacteria bacterium]
MKLFFEMFYAFFKIGTITIGSGFAMLPIIQHEVVDKKKWFSESEYMDILSVALSCPGPNIINLNVYLGLKKLGFWGFFAGALGTILPSFILILIIAIGFQNIQNNPYVIAAFKGIKPASVALISVPAISMAKNAKVLNKFIFIPLIIAALIVYMNVSPILFIACAIAFGNLIFKKK